MQSNTSNVDEYLASLEPETRQVLQAVRQLCLQELPGYREQMSYGMPAYANGDQIEVAFASQKRYLSFYFLKQSVLDQQRDDLQGHNLGKGCLRFSSPKRVDLVLLRKLLAVTYTLSAPVC